MVNEDGEVVLEKRGSQDQVAATVGEKREHLQGAVTIHNHPDGGTFSDEDLTEFGFGARQIVVASPEGTYKLTNMEYGTPKQSEGWFRMRDVVVIKYGGNNWVVDGNHRMAAAKLLGISSVTVKFIDADAMGISGKRRRR